MSIKVCLEGRTRSMKMPGRPAVGDVLARMGINPETVVVLKNGEVVPDSEPVSGKDRIEVLDIVSRG
jgi:sulfur carrier protein ThiS